MLKLNALVITGYHSKYLIDTTNAALVFIILCCHASLSFKSASSTKGKQEKRLFEHRESNLNIDKNNSQSDRQQ